MEKKIGVEYYKIHYRNMTLPDLFYQLQQHYSDTTIRFVILRGKWYIEDSEDKMFEINKNYNMDYLEDIKRIPMIPKFVAEWYESEGKRSSWWNWFYKWGRDESRSDLETKTIRWMQDFNEEKFVDIFKCGYKVEKENI